MSTTKKRTTKRKMASRTSPPAGSTSEAIRCAVDGMRAMHSLTMAARKIDSEAWKLIGELTRDRKEFPKAVRLGRLVTDTAELMLDGGSLKPLKIRTGTDGVFAVFADNFQDGFPGRIIIEIGHPVKKANTPGQLPAGQKGTNEEK